MNPTNRTGGGQFKRLGQQKTRMRIPQRSFAEKWREKFRRNRRLHDPMLVFNMSIFNFASGWERTFNPLKAHENGTR